METTRCGNVFHMREACHIADVPRLAVWEMWASKAHGKSKEAKTKRACERDESEDEES